MATLDDWQALAKLPPLEPLAGAVVTRATEGGQGIYASIHKDSVEERSGAEGDATAVDTVKSMPFVRSPPRARVADARVRFKFVPASVVSMLGRQQRGQLAPWSSAKSTHALEMLILGESSAEDMIRSRESSNSFLTNLVRALGFGAMFAGQRMALSFAPALVSYFPLLGGTLGSATGAAATVLAFATATTGTLLVVSAAWLRFRPVLAGGLAACAGGIACGLKYASRAAPAAASAVLATTTQGAAAAGGVPGLY